MATEQYLMEKYKKFLFNRTTVTPVIVECIENCLVNEEENSNQSFHKIMIHNWQDSLPQLFDVVSSYYGSSFIPVNCTSQGELISFYTSNLNLIMKLIKFDFMFPYSRSMFNVDVLFNDKTATDFFGRVTTVDDIVSGVVSRRFTEKCELDLSNFCEDPEFLNNKIFFFKLSLLAQFKILMLRMGRDTKKLILRNNNLSQAPVEILNFFIKSDLTAIDLSYNNIPSLQDLRVSSVIEKLWIEGNPLCEELDPITYVKHVSVKFPRLTELDGVKLNQHGISIPFFKNFLATPDKKTKLVVESFINNYFAHFDTKKGFKDIGRFYEEKATLTIATCLSDSKSSFKLFEHYSAFHRNFLNPTHKKKLAEKAKFRMYQSQQHIFAVFSKWPETVHDLNSFNVDVLCHNKSLLMLTVDGIYKELVGPGNPTENIFQFRRTFIFNIHTAANHYCYKIQHEMINVSLASTEQIRNSFQCPIGSTNTLTPVNPTNEEKEAIFKIFQHITQLKKTEAEFRLKYNCWNIYDALRDFTTDFSKAISTNSIRADRFLFEEEDFSDGSSLLDDID